MSAMTFERTLEPRSPALRLKHRTGEIYPLVYVRLTIESESDYAYDLRTWNMLAVDEADLCEGSRAQLHAWVADMRQQYADYVDEVEARAARRERMERLMGAEKGSA